MIFEKPFESKSNIFGRFEIEKIHDPNTIDRRATSSFFIFDSNPAKSLSEGVGTIFRSVTILLMLGGTVGPDEIESVVDKRLIIVKIFCQTTNSGVGPATFSEGADTTGHLDESRNIENEVLGVAEEFEALVGQSGANRFVALEGDSVPDYLTSESLPDIVIESSPAEPQNGMVRGLRADSNAVSKIIFVQLPDGDDGVGSKFREFRESLLPFIGGHEGGHGLNEFLAGEKENGFDEFFEHFGPIFQSVGDTVEELS
jgi:hypothetical protein